ncbi:adenosylcobinamide-GDP ribazoletransferase [Streptomyces sp. NPDC004976]
MLPGLHRRTTHAVLTAATALLTALVTTSPAAAAPAGATGFAGACPAAGFVSQHYHSGHDGVDIAGPYGTPIHAVGPGEVIASGPAQGYGQWIRILHPDGTAELLLRHCVRRFGGVTGDVFGGLAETAATAALVVSSLG